MTTDHQGQSSYGPAGGGHHPAGGSSYYGNHTGGGKAVNYHYHFCVKDLVLKNLTTFNTISYQFKTTRQLYMKYININNE